MNEEQKYLFDLTGYIIVENALTTDEVAQCNAAIDHHIEMLRERENSLAGVQRHLLGQHTAWIWVECWHGKNPGVSRSVLY